MPRITTSSVVRLSKRRGTNFYKLGLGRLQLTMQMSKTHTDVSLWRLIYGVMPKTMINVKTDTEVKNNARKLAEELGLSLSDIINISLRNFIRTREVRASATPQMTPELENLLGLIERDIKAGKNLSTTLETTREVRGHLDSL